MTKFLSSNSMFRSRENGCAKCGNAINKSEPATHGITASGWVAAHEKCVALMETHDGIQFSNYHNPSALDVLRKKQVTPAWGIGRK